MPGHVQGAPSTLGVAATLAAWTECDDWLIALRRMLSMRRDHLARRLAERLPDVGFDLPEATYLAWLDFREYGLGDDPAAYLLDQASVALSSGPQFGTGGAGFARLNFATSAELIVNRAASRRVGDRRPRTPARRAPPASRDVLPNRLTSAPVRSATAFSNRLTSAAGSIRLAVSNRLTRRVRDDGGSCELRPRRFGTTVDGVGRSPVTIRKRLAARPYGTA